jgi:Fe-S-cluster containining protein
MNFPCIQCGLCCRTLPGASFAAEYNLGDGVCKYLEGNLCTIYEKRPLVCNIADMYHAQYSDSMSEAEFVATNLRSCLDIARFHGDTIAIKKLEALQEDHLWDFGKILDKP